MRHSKSPCPQPSHHDKENCSRSANRRLHINQQHLQTLEETEKKMMERRRKSNERTTIRKYSPPPTSEQLLATAAEKSEKALSLLFNVLDEKRLGYLSKNNIACYRLAAPIYRIMKPLLIHIVESTSGSHVTDYKQFRRLAIRGKIDEQLYEKLFTELY